MLIYRLLNGGFVKKFNVIAFYLFSIFAVGQMHIMQASPSFFSDCKALLSKRETLVGIGALVGSFACLAYWFYNSLTKPGTKEAQLPSVFESRPELSVKRESVVSAKERKEPAVVLTKRYGLKSATNQRNFIIINDLPRWDHAQWIQYQDNPHSWGGAATWSLFKALEQKRVPIYTNKILLAYLSASDFVCRAELVNLLENDWHIYDINQEYCLLLPVQWINLYTNSELGTGIVGLERLIQVTVADICKQVTGKYPITKSDMIAQTGSDGHELERRKYLFDDGSGVYSEAGLATLLSDQVQWNIAIMGHGGRGFQRCKLSCLNDYLCGMPRQTFVDLLATISATVPVRMVYFCTCYGLSEVSDAAFDNSEIERIFDFPIMGSVCYNGESSTAFFDGDGLFLQCRHIENLDREHEAEIFAACMILNDQLTPSIRWAGANNFVPLQGLTEKVSVLTSAKLACGVIVPPNLRLTVLLKHKNDILDLPQNTSRIILVHKARNRSYVIAENSV